MILLSNGTRLFFENLNELTYFPNDVKYFRRYVFIDWINSTENHIVFKNDSGYHVYAKSHQKGDIYKKHYEQCEIPIMTEEYFHDMTGLMLFMKDEILKKGYTLEDIENNQNVPHHDLPFVHTERQIQEMHARVCK